MLVAEFNGGKDPTLVDTNRDGIVGLADVTAFINLFNGTFGLERALPDSPVIHQAVCNRAG